MCLQRMWSISRDKDVPTKTMNRKVIDSQRVQGRVPQRRSLGVLGKDEVASSNLASSSKKALEPQRFWGFWFFAENLTAKKPLQKPLHRPKK